VYIVAHCSLLLVTKRLVYFEDVCCVIRRAQSVVEQVSAYVDQLDLRSASFSLCVESYRVPGAHVG